MRRVGIGSVSAGIAAAVAISVMAGCTGGASRRPASSAATSSPPPRAAMHVRPQTALEDVPVTATISGLKPGSAVAVTARAVDGHGVTWHATADFTASADGTVSLSQPSTGGSYTGADAMGLIELMRPATGRTMILIPPAAGDTITFTASVAGKVVATTTATRRSAQAVGVTATVETLAKTGIHATLFEPRTPATRRPAVLIFGGSGGGEEEDFDAGMLAAHGYPALSLAYFREPGLPPTLTDVPLEYFARALHLLAGRPGVDPRHVLTWGTSRGSEAALLLGADYPSLVHGVIAGSPSNKVNVNYPDTGHNAWTWHGHPLTPAPVRDSRSLTAPSATLIPVERIAGPVLTICGQVDNLWPSCKFADAIHARRRAHHVAYTDIALSYPGAGHSIGNAQAYYAAASQQAELDGYLLGGTRQDNLAAAGRAHQSVLAFLARQ